MRNTNERYSASTSVTSVAVLVVWGITMISYAVSWAIYYIKSSLIEFRMEENIEMDEDMLIEFKMHRKLYHPYMKFCCIVSTIVTFVWFAFFRKKWESSS